MKPKLQSKRPLSPTSPGVIISQTSSQNPWESPSPSDKDRRGSATAFNAIEPDPIAEIQVKNTQRSPKGNFNQDLLPFGIGSKDYQDTSRQQQPGEFAALKSKQMAFKKKAAKAVKLSNFDLVKKMEQNSRFSQSLQSRFGYNQTSEKRRMNMSQIHLPEGSPINDALASGSRFQSQMQPTTEDSSVHFLGVVGRSVKKTEKLSASVTVEKTDRTSFKGDMTPVPDHISSVLQSVRGSQGNVKGSLQSKRSEAKKAGKSNKSSTYRSSKGRSIAGGKQIDKTTQDVESHRNQMAQTSGFFRVTVSTGMGQPDNFKVFNKTNYTDNAPGLASQAVSTRKKTQNIWKRSSMEQIPREGVGLKINLSSAYEGSGQGKRDSKVPTDSQGDHTHQTELRDIQLISPQSIDRDLMLANQGSSNDPVDINLAHQPFGHFSEFETETFFLKQPNQRVMSQPPLHIPDPAAAASSKYRAKNMKYMKSSEIATGRAPPRSSLQNYRRRLTNKSRQNDDLQEFLPLINEFTQSYKLERERRSQTPLFSNPARHSVNISLLQNKISALANSGKDGSPTNKENGFEKSDDFDTDISFRGRMSRLSAPEIIEEDPSTAVNLGTTPKRFSILKKNSSELASGKGSPHFSTGMNQTPFLGDKPSVDLNFKAAPKQVNLAETAFSEKPKYDMTEKIIPPHKKVVDRLYPSLSVMNQKLRGDLNKEMQLLNGLHLSNSQTNKLTNEKQRFMDLNVVEAWLNDTLKEAEYFGLPGIIKNKSKSTHKPLFDYKLDRSTLSMIGINDGNISRFYRALFVYSMGFYSNVSNLIDESCNQTKMVSENSRHKTKGSLLSSIWRVYQILIEFCNTSNFKSKITNVLDEAERILDEKEKTFNQLLENEEIRNKRTQLEHIQVDEKLRQALLQLLDQRAKYDRLSEEFRQHREMHEAEINLRMQFEDKLNQLHALNRTFNDAATKNEKIKNEQQEKITRLSKELMEALSDLQNERAQRQKVSITNSQQEIKINCKVEELVIKQQMLDNLSADYSRISEKLANYTKSDMEKSKIIKKHEQLIDELTKLNEDLSLKEKSMTLKYESTRQSLQEVTLEKDDLERDLTVTKRELTHVTDQHKKVRADRDELEKELKELKQTKTYTEDQYLKRLLDIESLQNIIGIKDYQADQMEAAFKDQIEKIEGLDKAKFLSFEREQKLQFELDLTKNKLDNVDKKAKSFRDKNDDLEIQIQNTYDNLEQQKKLFQAKNLEYDALKRKAHDEKQHIADQLVRAQRDFNQSEYELDKAKKEIDHLNAKLLEARQVMTTQKNRINFLECDIQNKKDEVDILNESKQNLMSENNANISKGDTLKRNLLQANQHQKFIKEQKKKEIEKIIEDYALFRKITEDNQMITEDYRSNVVRKAIQIKQLNAIVRELDIKVQAMDQSIPELTNELNNLRDERNDFERKLKRKTQDFDEKEIELQEVSQANLNLEIQVQTKEARIEELEGEVATLETKKTDIEEELREALARLHVFEVVERESVSCGRTFHHDPFKFNEMQMYLTTESLPTSNNKGNILNKKDFGDLGQNPSSAYFQINPRDGSREATSKERSKERSGDEAAKQRTMGFASKEGLPVIDDSLSMQSKQSKVSKVSSILKKSPERRNKEPNSSEKRKSQVSISIEKGSSVQPSMPQLQKDDSYQLAPADSRIMIIEDQDRSGAKSASPSKRRDLHNSFQNRTSSKQDDSNKSVKFAAAQTLRPTSIERFAAPRRSHVVKDVGSMRTTPNKRLGSQVVGPSKKKPRRASKASNRSLAKLDLNKGSVRKLLKQRRNTTRSAYLGQQFPFHMRFLDTGVQCMKMTEESILEKALPNLLAKEREKVTEELREQIEAELREKLEQEFEEAGKIKKSFQQSGNFEIVDGKSFEAHMSNTGASPGMREDEQQTQKSSYKTQSKHDKKTSQNADSQRRDSLVAGMSLENPGASTIIGQAAGSEILSNLVKDLDEALAESNHTSKKSPYDVANLSGEKSKGIAILKPNLEFQVDKRSYSPASVASPQMKKKPVILKKQTTKLSTRGSLSKDRETMLQTNRNIKQLLRIVLSKQ